MLSILHQKINQIANILSIEKISDNYIIQYEDAQSVTDEQITAIDSVLNEWPLTEAKIDKIKLLDNNWDTQLKNGFITSYGWKLGLKNSDVTLLTGAFLLGKEAAAMGLSQDATIIDIDGISHTLNINDLTVLMLQYGQYRTALSTEYSNKKTEIENAISIEELNNIIIQG